MTDLISFHKNKKNITILVLLIAFIAGIASSAGIYTNSGNGTYEYLSIRGKSIQIYGKGLYHHMSSDVAIQGIAQDYITLFIAIPLLLIALYFAWKGSLRGRFVLAGVLYYFFVTYIMYLEIAMYNAMFLGYVLLIGCSFFAIAILLLSFHTERLPLAFNESTPVKFTGGFLIFNSIMIGLLWLSVVIPPLIDGSIIPDSVQHYSTLTVQGLDLALFLPIGLVSGALLRKRNPLGYLLGTINLIFLPILMTALTAKLIAMAHHGVNVIPAVFIIPVILAISAICGILLLKNIKVNS